MSLFSFTKVIRRCIVTASVARMAWRGLVMIDNSTELQDFVGVANVQ